MIHTQEFGNTLKAQGFDFFSGVPCSFLKYFINHALNEGQVIMAANEGDAVATCAGAHLAGKKAIFFCQNSGLTNAMSPLSSLIHPFRIPLLGFVTLRGAPELQDEPQHELMGKITTQLLDDLEIAWEYLAQNTEEAIQQLKKAQRVLETDQPFFFVVRKGSFDTVELTAQSRDKQQTFACRVKQGADQESKRHKVLTWLAENRDDKTLLITNTGYTSRELFQIQDAPNNFYMVGSMGCVAALGLGLALARPDSKVVVIDGDGSLLMRLGAALTNGHYQPPNLLHLVLNNMQHESTGGQATVAGEMDFPTMMSSAGYRRSYHLHNLSELATVYREWSASPALTFCHLKITPGSLENLMRPTITPVDVKKRFMKHIRTLF